MPNKPRTPAAEAAYQEYLRQKRNPAYQVTINEGSRGVWYYTEYDWEAIVAAIEATRGNV